MKETTTDFWEYFSILFDILINTCFQKNLRWALKDLMEKFAIFLAMLMFAHLILARMKELAFQMGKLLNLTAIALLDIQVIKIDLNICLIFFFLNKISKNKIKKNEFDLNLHKMYMNRTF